MYTNNPLFASLLAMSAIIESQHYGAARPPRRTPGSPLCAAHLAAHKAKQPDPGPHDRMTRQRRRHAAHQADKEALKREFSKGLGMVAAFSLEEERS